MLIPFRFKMLGLFVQMAVCCCALNGCATKAGHGLNTEVPHTEVRNTTIDPLSALTNLRELATTQDELISLLGAYQGLWRENSDTAERQSELQGELNRKAAEQQGIIDRANAAEAAQQKLDRTWMFVLLGAGIALVLGAGALAYFGWSMPGVPSGKAAIFIGMVGLAFLLMAPSARAFAPGLRIIVFTVLGASAAMLLAVVAKGVIDTWRSNGGE